MGTAAGAPARPWAPADAVAAMALNATSPLPARLAGYLEERFPPVAYTLLVGLFFGSAVIVAGADGGSTLDWPAGLAGAAVVWLVFLHLRIFDEHKDFARDRSSHPQRLLSRGVVTLPLLMRVALLAIVVEAVLAGLVGGRAFVAWLVALSFSVAMRVEFGAGRVLGRHIVLYALTHNPIVACLALFLWACSGAAWNWAFLWYVGLASFGSLAFEMGRKTRLPDEEIPGVDSYSSVHGRGRAGVMVRAAVVLAALTGVGCLLATHTSDLRMGIGAGLLGTAAGAAVALAGPSVRRSRVEAGTTAFLLASFLAVGIAAW